MNDTEVENGIIQNPAIQNSVQGARRESSIATPAKGSTPSLADDLEAERIYQKAGALIMSARRAQHKGQKDEARKLLQQAFLIAPNDSGGLELLGDLFMEDGEQEKAMKIFERGLEHHPKHRAFEEKIALCHIDVDEMRRDRDRRTQILEQGGIEKWQLLSAPRAFTLSALLPGAGQAYIGQSSRALTLFGITVLTFLGWALPLYFGLGKDDLQGKGWSRFGAALGNMNGLGLIWFWLMVAGWVAIYIYASMDAMTQAEKINELRKQGWEVFED